MINKRILKFPDKKETMAIDEDPFPPVPSVNIASFDLRALIESKKARKLSPGKVWVTKYYLVHVDRLKKGWAAVCTDPPSGRNSMKGIQQGTEQQNSFSKKMKLSPKGKTNSPKEFIPPREKVVESPTPPWGRFISQMDNDAGRFRECSSRKIVFSLRGKFTPLNGKIEGKVNSLRKNTGERHVYPLRPMFPKGGPISLRYRMRFTKDNFTLQKVNSFPQNRRLQTNSFLQGI